MANRSVGIGTNTTLNLSYDTKDQRINQLIDQIFKEVSEDDIKVGLIDPILGYVVEVSICEANDYAKDNPGTAFIFRDANNSIQYLNINEVNALTPEVLVSSASTCSGIQTRKKCGEGPPRIQFFGGDGVGAQANAIVGIDGAILAIDVISGGAAGNWFLDHRGSTMTRSTFAPGFKLALHHKDLKICQTMASKANVAIPLSDMTVIDYEQLMRDGYGDEDISALYRLKRS